MQSVMKKAMGQEINSDSFRSPPLPVLPLTDWPNILPDNFDDADSIPSTPLSATAAQRYDIIGLSLFRFATAMALVGEMPMQPKEFAKCFEAAAESNQILKPMLAKSDQRIVANNVGLVQHGFYVFVAAVWFATGRNKGPVPDWLVSMLEPLVKAAGRAVKSNLTWYKQTRAATQISRTADETLLLQNIRNLQLEDVNAKRASFNHPVNIEEALVPEVRIQSPASSDEGSPAGELRQMAHENDAARRSARADADMISREPHLYAHLQDTAPRENAFAPTLLNPGDDEPNPFGMGDLDRELDERVSFLAVRELILNADRATMAFLRAPVPTPKPKRDVMPARRPLTPLMLNLTEVLDLPEEFEFKAHVRASTGPASVRYI
ncbi:hypothetical protein C8R43DRAFT_1018066 [Mycena crocata]|nr:hypothetical protein C8R43DRAFT_1018066 [Mycena crocata]